MGQGIKIIYFALFLYEQIVGFVGSRFLIFG